MFQDVLLQGYHSIQVHRVAHALWSQGRKVLALALQSRISEVALYFDEQFNLI